MNITVELNDPHTHKLHHKNMHGKTSLDYYCRKHGNTYCWCMYPSLTYITLDNFMEDRQK